MEEKRLLLADRGMYAGWDRVRGSGNADFALLCRSSLFAPADTLQERIDSWLAATTSSQQYDQTALELLRDEALRVRAEEPAPALPAPTQAKEQSAKDAEE